jgi:hypothetical protein
MKTGILQHKPVKKAEMVSTKMVLWSKVQAMVEDNFYFILLMWMYESACEHLN